MNGLAGARGIAVLAGMLLIVISITAGCGSGEVDLTFEEQAEKLIVRTIGKSPYEQYQDRVVNIRVDDLEGYEKAFIVIVADGGSSGQAIKAKIHENCIKLFPALFEKFDNLEGVHMEWQVPLFDKYGNESLQSVVYISLRRDRSESINWKDFQPLNFPNVCEYYWEEPILE